MSFFRTNTNPYVKFKIDAELLTCEFEVPRRSNNKSIVSPQACGRITMCAQAPRHLSSSYPKSFGSPNSALEKNNIWQKQNLDLTSFFSQCMPEEHARWRHSLKGDMYKTWAGCKAEVSTKHCFGIRPKYKVGLSDLWPSNLLSCYHIFQVVQGRCLVGFSSARPDFFLSPFP